MIYELINPSDAIVFDAPSDDVAALAALVVGEGRYGAKNDETRESVIGIALFGGDGGYEERYGRTVDVGLAELAADVVTACHSFRLRRGKRTSLNDIVGRAHSVVLNTRPSEVPDVG